MGMGLTTWAMLVNRFFSSAVHLQPDLSSTQLPFLLRLSLCRRPISLHPDRRPKSRNPFSRSLTALQFVNRPPSLRRLRLRPGKIRSLLPLLPRRGRSILANVPHCPPTAPKSRPPTPLSPLWSHPSRRLVRTISVSGPPSHQDRCGPICRRPSVCNPRQQPSPGQPGQ